MKRESPGNTRRKVLWIGPPPDAALARECANRGLIVAQPPAEGIDGELSFATGLVFRFDSGQAEVFEEQVKKLASNAVDHGLFVLLLAESDQAFLAMDTVAKKLRLGIEIAKKVSNPPHEIAELMARHDPGPGEADVALSGVRVSDQTRLFLRRAFWDCKSISIARLTEGRSAEVFSVHALFRDSRVGPRPLPFFAKVDRRAKILSEWNNYQNIVGHYIPFHSRPNLEPERCLLGATHGILVGNFVEQSESLWKTAKRGSAQPVLYSLFDHALRGWRLQAYAQDEALAFGTSLFLSLKHLVDPSKPVFRKRASDATAFGKVQPLDDMLAVLQAKGAIKHRIAPQHGDLHVKNIRACRGEAILIDFNSTRYSGPLVADPACLEVSLVFEADPSDPVDADNEGWHDLVENLYKPEYLHHAPPPPKEPAPREWMWACVRQIRLIALDSQTSDREYQFALILYLLRCASFPDESGPDKYRRDYAYYLASRLTDDL